jgi:hypothetical protein
MQKQNTLIQRPLIIIGVIFVLKLCTAIWLAYITHENGYKYIYGLAAFTEDTGTYIGPIENFIKHGQYFWGYAKAGRTPYYGLIYYPFRVFFSMATSYNILVIIQLIAESAAIFYMAKTCQLLTNMRRAFWLYLWLSIISLYVTYYVNYIFPESLSIGLLSLFLYQYVLFLIDGRKPNRLLIAGVFLALAVLIKPLLGLLYIIVLIEIGLKVRKLPLQKVLFLGLLVSAPIVIIDAPWTIRNYLLFRDFFPFQENHFGGYNYSRARISVRTFIQVTGESFIFWEANTAGCYFEPRAGKACTYQLPERVLRRPLSAAIIDDARKTYLAYQKKPSDSLEMLTIQKFDNLSLLYQRAHPTEVKIITPALLAKKLLFHSGSYYLPWKKPASGYKPWQLAIKLTQSGLYYLCLFGGSVGSLLLLFANKRSFMVFLIPVYVLAVVVFLFKLTEYRYFHIAYPFLMIGTCYLLLRIQGAITKRIP